MSSGDEKSRPRLARGVRLGQDRISGEPVLLFPEGFLPLDEITHDILVRCSGQQTVEMIIDALAAEYEADYDTVRADVCECLNQLRQQMLVAFWK